MRQNKQLRACGMRRPTSVALSRALCWCALLGHSLWATVACGNDWSVQARPWPEADELFKRDSRWRGGDAANSIDLGQGRVLWTFGDSFVDLNDVPQQRHRQRATFIRNSIAIQTGYDPVRAQFQPHWQMLPSGKPAAFLPAEGEVLFWPGGGLLVDNRLLIFLMRIRNSSGGLGFKVDGWGAVMIDNPHDQPQDWHLKFIHTPQNDLKVLVGSGSSVRVGAWVYAFSAEFATHQLFLVRYSVPAILVGDLSQPQWWTGQRGGWVPQRDLEQHPPQPIVKRGQTEFTVHFEKRQQRYLLTQFTGFPRTPVAIRHATDLTGPWSPMQDAFRPAELDNPSPDLMLYAAKSHPEQLADGLAVTYCSNTIDLAKVVVDERLYYPRFARLTFARDAK